MDQAEPLDNLLPKVHALITRCRHQEGRSDIALESCRKGRAAFPQHAELLFWEAVLLHERGELAGAETSLKQLLALPKAINFSSADSGMQGYRARQFLAEICQAQGPRKPRHTCGRSWPKAKGSAYIIRHLNRVQEATRD